jgi:hypothetical protein
MLDQKRTIDLLSDQPVTKIRTTYLKLYKPVHLSVRDISHSNSKLVIGKACESTHHTISLGKNPWE